MIFRKHIPRRTILRGLGAAVALPLLDAMIPAFATRESLAAATVRRFGVVFTPMGMNMFQWTPKTEGPLELSPILQPSMAPFRERLLVVSGLDSERAVASDGAGHPRTQTTWNTGTAAFKTEGANIRAGISLDQVVAAEFGKETQLTSLELTLDPWDMASTGCQGYSCAYNATISWRTPTLPLPMEGTPAAVFERLFGLAETTDASARLNGLRRYRSILDGMTDKVLALQQRLGASDRTKVAGYLEAIRDVERRIQKAEEQSDRELPLVDRPVRIPENYVEYGDLMFDLLVLGLQTDLTRVFTFAIGQEQNLRTYPEIGVTEPHHPLSHHGNLPEKLAALAKVNAYHVSLFSHLLEKLQAIPDGEGTLLDHTLMLFGSGMSDSNNHHPFNVPTMVVGGPDFSLTGGRHIRYPQGMPLANLQLTLLHKMGLRVDHFGDSTRMLSEV